MSCIEAVVLVRAVFILYSVGFTNGITDNTTCRKSTNLLTEPPWRIPVQNSASKLPQIIINDTTEWISNNETNPDSSDTFNRDQVMGDQKDILHFGGEHLQTKHKYPWCVIDQNRTDSESVDRNDNLDRNDNSTEDIFWQSRSEMATLLVLAWWIESLWYRIVVSFY